MSSLLRGLQPCLGAAPVFPGPRHWAPVSQSPVHHVGFSAPAPHRLREMGSLLDVGLRYALGEPWCCSVCFAASCTSDFPEGPSVPPSTRWQSHASRPRAWEREQMLSWAAMETNVLAPAGGRRRVAAYRSECFQSTVRPSPQHENTLFQYRARRKHQLVPLPESVVLPPN